MSVFHTVTLLSAFKLNTEKDERKKEILAVLIIIYQPWNIEK